MAPVGKLELDAGVGLFQHHHRFQSLGECLDQLSGKGVGSADLQHRHLHPQLLQHLLGGVEGDAGGDHA